MGDNVQVDYKKTILKTVLYTLLVLVVLFAIVVMLMFFVFTKNMADFMYNIGWNSMASCLYYKTYEKNDEIIYCYKALNININLNDSDKIIEYFESFVEDNEYDEFMSESKNKSENLKVGNLEKSTLLNDKNYLINHYVKSLIEEERVDDALEVALSEFSSYNEFNLRNQGVYALSPFVSRQNYEKFNFVYDGFDEKLILEMQKYFDNAYAIFETNKESDGSLDKAYLIALGNRIIIVGQDINSICRELDINTGVIPSNIEMMTAVNNEIKGLV